MDTEQKEHVEEKTIEGTVKYVVLPDHEKPYSATNSVKKIMTEQTTASPIMNILPNGGAGRDDGYGGMGALASILPIALLAPLLTGRGFGRDGEGSGRNLEAVIAEQVGDIRHDLGESTVSNLKETFHAEKDAIIAGFKAQLETEKAINKIENKIGECCEEEQKAIAHLKSDMDKQFCHVEEMMEAKFNRLEMDEKNEQIRTLRERLEVSERASQTATIISTILGAVGVVVPVPLAKKA